MEMFHDRAPSSPYPAVDLPTGTVTFLFTDIEGSTKLWQAFPESMKAALERHHALLQSAIESHGGYVFQIVGDAFCAAFRTAPEGVAAALAAQRALARQSWGETGPVRVRMALHSGTAEVEAGAYRSGEYASGLTLSRAARLLSAGHGGQILLSRVAQELARDRLPPDAGLRDLGERRLRDLVHPEHIFQLVAPDLPIEFPALRSLDILPNNLPLQLTSFIGREPELRDISGLLRENRLATLTGPGGTGKTRLALQVGADAFETFPDGVWLVELASLSNPALVPQAVASVVDIREETNTPLLTTLSDQLRRRRLLLILDNCEHLVEPCAELVAALLRTCAQVKILATTREPLGVAGEVVFRVPSLSVPEVRNLPAVERLTEYDAVRLLVHRATAARPDFAVTSVNAAAVVQICQRLDGIPLAIELAAARLKVLSPQQIAAHLNERFHLLTGGNRTALPRHQTLRGLIDWSYGLLVDAERELLRRLSVFAGGWTLTAAEAIGVGGSVGRDDVLDLLSRLVDKSLVMTDEQADETRYRLLETVREYSLDRLREAAEDAGARDRHRDFYLAFGEEAAPQLRGPDQTAWLKRLASDHDNFRAALRWSLDAGDVEKSLRLGASLWQFWDTHAHVTEGLDWLEQILAGSGELPPTGLTAASKRARARFLDGVARMCTRRSEFDRAKETCAQSLALWRELGDRAGTAEVLNNLGDLNRQLGDRRTAQVMVEESLALFRAVADRRGIAHALNNLADIVLADGDESRAERLFEEGIPLFREIRDERSLAHGLNNLGGIAARKGDLDRASGKLEAGPAAR
jgi:predicted ATPase/class 3 adenylate cyclase